MAEEPRTFHITDGWTGERFETVPRAALSACQEERDEARAYVKVLNESWVEQMRRAEAAETALRACQEELARVRAELARLRGGVGPAADERISLTNRAEAAEAARDELARLIAEQRIQLRQVIERLDRALSSEATKE